MGKVRLKLFLDKLKEIKFRSFHGRRRSSVASHSIETPKSIRRSPYQKSLSFVHCDRCPKTSIESGFCFSPLNRKALDISFPVSPKRSPLILSPARFSPAAIVLLNSPINHQVSYGRSLHPSTPRAKTVAVSNEASVSFGCGCNAPLASSFRKAKENFQALSASMRLEDFDRQQSKRGQKEDRNKQRLSLKAGMEKTLGTCIAKREVNGKSANEMVLSNYSFAEKNCLESTLEHLIRPKDAASSKSPSSAGRRRISELCNLSLSTSSSGVTLDSGSFAWDKESSSFTSDDNFPLWKGPGSSSSNSSSEFLETDHVFFSGPQNDATEAGESLFDDWANGVFEDHAEKNKKVLLRSESFGRNKSTSSQIKSSQMGDEIVNYPWLSPESSSSCLETSDIEPMPKASEESVTSDINGSDSKRQVPIIKSRNVLSSNECVERKGQRWYSKGRKKAGSSCNASQQQTCSEDLSSNRLAVSKNKPTKGSKKGNFRRGSQQQSCYDDSDRMSSSKNQPTKAFNKASSTYRRKRSQQQCCTQNSSPYYGKAENKPTGKGIASQLRRTDAEGINLKSIPANLQGKIADQSVAVVKCSRDPYLEFRDSMVDMILEKQMYETRDLEELLQCFLSLNSLEHHDTIVRAFTEVWGKVFGCNAGNLVVY